MCNASLRLLILLALALLPTGVAAREPEPTAEARAAWGFDRSDLPPHPGVRFGVLPNGMRYAIMRNADPAGALSVRMRIDVGATAEGAREQGYVHLIEHLIFHGSRNYPQGSLLLSLPRDGLRRASDFNAITDYRQTVYRLDLARSDARARETALRLMSEIARHLSFSRGTLRRAKGEVIEEIRARDRGRDLLMTAQNNFLLPATPLARGPVAGSEASVRRANATGIRRLYDLYYAPARTSLVMVGDFDPAVAEAEIVAHLSDWQARAPDVPAAPPPVVPARPGGATEIFVHPDVPTSVTIALVRPLGPDGDTAASRNSHFLEQLGHEMLNRRLAAMAESPHASFGDPLAAAYNYYSTARVASIDLFARGGDWRAVLRAGRDALLRALDEGFDQAELDAQLAAIRNALDRTASPRTSTALADAIIDAADRDIVFTVPSDAAASVAWLDRVALDEVNHVFRALWNGSGRLIFVSHNRRISEEELTAAVSR